jgi:O-antigen polymerase
MLWLVDRFALSDDESNRSIAISKTFLFRFIALLIPLIFIPFMFTALHTAHILVEHEKNPTSQQALESLSDIINPIAWQSRLDAAVYAHILIDGIRNKDIDKLKSYLIWAIKRLKHQPRPSLYRNSLLILKALNQEQGYQLLLQEAKRTYPQEDNWHNSILSQDKSVK